MCVLCAPLPRWVLGASVGWLCVGWLALRHLLQDPSFRKGLEVQGRPVVLRLFVFCVLFVLSVCLLRTMVKKKITLAVIAVTFAVDS